MDANIGFIILRHVNNSQTNNYWINCYNSIRKFYPLNKILIIDDNSDYTFVTSMKLQNTIIINSENNLKKRGELLPYHYYLHNKFSDIAIILHDSTFFNTYIDLSLKDNEQYKLIWEFEHDWDNTNDEVKIIKSLNLKDNELLDYYYNKHFWKGCFGAMTIIRHNFLVNIDKKYNISSLINQIITRTDRCCFERVFACILQKESQKHTLLGNIHSYVSFGAINYENRNKFLHLPLVKIWTGR